MKQLKALFSNVMSKGKLFVASLLTLVAAPVFAAIPTEATAALTALKDDITSMIGLVWPVVIVGVVGFALIKLFKRGASKAV